MTQPEWLSTCKGVNGQVTLVWLKVHAVDREVRASFLRQVGGRGKQRIGCDCLPASTSEPARRIINTGQVSSKLAVFLKRRVNQKEIVLSTRAASEMMQLILGGRLQIPSHSISYRTLLRRNEHQRATGLALQTHLQEDNTFLPEMIYATLANTLPFFFSLSVLWKQKEFLEKHCIRTSTLQPGCDKPCEPSQT